MATKGLYKINACAIIKCLPDWEWDTGGHSDYDLWLVLGGEATLTVAGTPYEVKRGDYFLLPPDTRISGRHNPACPLVAAYVHFDFLDGQDREFVHRFAHDVQFLEKLTSRLFFYENLGKQKEATLWLEAALTELYDLPSDGNEGMAVNTNVRYVREICSAINENVASVSTLASVARNYGYSATYFGKIFRNETGVTFSQYVMNARINNAKTLLKSTDLSVAEIAERLGYYDACHFIRQFKSVVGVNPGGYRRQE